MPASDGSSSSQPRPVVSTCPHHSARCLRVGRPRATAPPRQRGPVPVVGVLSLPARRLSTLCIQRISTIYRCSGYESSFVHFAMYDRYLHLACIYSLHHSSPSPPSICPVTR